MPPNNAWTRESFLARLSDLLRRTATEDCEELVRLLELNLPAAILVDPYEEARLLMRQGRKIEAIKIVREKTGLGLKEAKDLVETPGWAETPGSPHAPGPPSVEPARMDEIQAFIDAGQLIDAIKLYRELTGLGLKESKDAIDAMARGERGLR